MPLYYGELTFVLWVETPGGILALFPAETKEDVRGWCSKTAYSDSMCQNTDTRRVPYSSEYL